MPATPSAWRRLRGAWRVLRVVVHGLHGLAIVRWRYPALDRAERRARVQWWSAKMLRLIGMRLEMRGRFDVGAKLLVVNHVSWLDIMAVHAVCPEARFVSKAEVRHWPFVGELVAGAETLYIDREKRRDALRVVHEMAAALRNGDTVAVFPEGTPTDGSALLPFHANLLQAALSTASPVQTVALRFADAEHDVSPAAAYVGETTLTQSLWHMACSDGMVVHVAVQAPHAVPKMHRRQFAELLRAEIAATLAA